MSRAGLYINRLLKGYEREIDIILKNFILFFIQTNLKV